MKYQVKTGLLVCGLLFVTYSYADKGLEDLSEKQRIQRLERLISSDVLRQQTQTMQSLREEISLLRGQTEQLEYELNSMKQRQRNLYLDMDRRINTVEAGGGAGSNVVSPVPVPNSKGAAASSNSDVDGQEAYSKAFALLKEGQYKQSISAFESFKKNYPKSKYASNAQYWLGEASYVSRDYNRSLKEFQYLIAQYPKSSKISGAHLKIGYVHFELKDWPAAREALQKVVKLYPNTTVSKKANERLQRMKREGH